jgi:hypothetical protein
MWLIAVLLLVALLIPIMGIVVDSPIGRALARRLEGGTPEVPPALDDLVKKVDLLEAEVDDLTRSVQAQDENTFLQRLLTEPSSRSTLPRPPA